MHDNEIEELRNNNTKLHSELSSANFYKAEALEYAS